MNRVKINIAAIFIFLAVAVFYSLPDIVGYTKSTENQKYIGNSYLWDPWDVNVYVSVIRYSQTFGLHYENLFTTEKFQNNVLVYPLYSFTGTVFKNPNPYLIYNIAAFFFTFTLMLTIYYFSYVLTKKYLQALIITLIASFGGGFGWLFLIFGIYIPDISLTPFILANAFQRPHTSLALAFYVLSLTLYYRSVNELGFRKVLPPYVFALLAGFIYPYLLLSYCLIVFLFSLLSSLKNNNVYIFKRSLFFLFLLLLTGLPYSVYILSAKGLSDVLSPNLPTPNIILFLLGIGLFNIPLIRNIKKYNSNPFYLFIYIWISVHLFLAYLPFGFARYYFLGIFIPLSFLMIGYLQELYKKKQVALIVLVLILVSTTSVITLLLRVVNVWSYQRELYFNKSDLEAIHYINEFPLKSGVLTPYPFANYIPAIKPLYVYFGHLYQTPNSNDKQKLLISFFDNQMNESEAKDFLSKNSINYVIWKKEGSSKYDGVKADKPRYEFLREIYSNEDYLIMSND